MKINKTLVISTILCIIPMILSIFLYNKLPEKIPTHFNINGEVDSYGSKLFVYILLPIILCMVNILLNIILNNDPKKQNHNETLLTICKFIIPLMSLIFIPSSILISLGFNINIAIIAPIFISIIFILIGNYLPKCRPNYTMGIRLPWTLNNENNWIKTHRLSGFLWVISGLILLLTTLINKNLSFYVLIISIILTVIIPCIYSFILYKKYKRT
ncbi:SdpI family protein [Candidatus Arthromitus sp. SFB-turkey]|uniref:SdpI family protein n=1 Tax=Candidatus Arthromitus sp. SFB-turkey TaxID=1840217 RepID=UPI0007F38B80|nr:SdpI family protein [Candidatus Arthromitus sp. SFB-turkey]OAT87006.1 hypothetical protein A6P36_01815 [Candidatus Arthromitus sp. SFB-turkey]